MSVCRRGENLQRTTNASSLADHLSKLKRFMELRLKKSLKGDGNLNTPDLIFHSFIMEVTHSTNAALKCAHSELTTNTSEDLWRKRFTLK